MQANATSSSPVGFFDSGRGGLCILEAFRKLAPREPTVYIADSANCPYGNKSAGEILALSRANARRLLENFGCKMIVVACNTATAAAIDSLRREFPDTPFIGIEPAVKPAAMRSRSGIVGVLATAGTFSGRLYNETKAKFARDTTVIATVADEFVTLVEEGRTDGPEVEEAVRRRLAPLLDAGADNIVLGCTHFPHLRKVMERICAGKAEIVDPAQAVARQAVRVLAKHSLGAKRADRTPLDLRLNTRRTPDAAAPARSVLVTGGVRRIGRAIADRLAAANWRVLRASHRDDPLADITCDLASDGAADALFAAATALLGSPPAAIVNNAAVYPGEEDEAWRVNAAVPIRLTEAMAESSQGGAVVNILDAAVASGRAETRAEFKAYERAKQALHRATLEDAARFSGRLHVYGVAPGPVLAPEAVHEKARLSPGQTRRTPADVADTVLRMLESRPASGAIEIV